MTTRRTLAALSEEHRWLWGSRCKGELVEGGLGHREGAPREIVTEVLYFVWEGGKRRMQFVTFLDKASF